LVELHQSDITVRYARFDLFPHQFATFERDSMQQSCTAGVELGWRIQNWTEKWQWQRKNEWSRNDISCPRTNRFLLFNQGIWLRFEMNIGYDIAARVERLYRWHFRLSLCLPVIACDSSNLNMLRSSTNVHEENITEFPFGSHSRHEFCPWFQASIFGFKRPDNRIMALSLEFSQGNSESWVSSERQFCPGWSAQLTNLNRVMIDLLMIELTLSRNDFFSRSMYSHDRDHF
jgi:hypothetical protein